MRQWAFMNGKWGGQLRRRSALGARLLAAGTSDGRLPKATGLESPMPMTAHSLRRGLSLLELLLALTITAIVMAAIAGMLGAVSAGVTTGRDMRSVMVLGHVASTRLSSYITPSRCLLHVDGSNLVLWQDDLREGDTVHATEVRWLLFDPVEGAIRVHFVKCPVGWTKAACDLNDHEYPANSNWMSVLATYQTRGWVSSRVLVDRLSSVQIATNDSTALASAFVSFTLGFNTDSGEVPLLVSSAIAHHRTPVN
jgi:prepilin-type N-terminal cleavage/methylation domain-containing protein